MTFYIWSQITVHTIIKGVREPPELADLREREAEGAVEHGARPAADPEGRDPGNFQSRNLR